ncbi:hypothetical protein BH11BAC2_BH11BAC2_03640 [soil metagenome]
MNAVSLYEQEKKLSLKSFQYWLVYLLKRTFLGMGNEPNLAF